ncbi:MAG: ComEC/Rec2 family competence protein [Parcubacteria group bacterium]|nr:ComEC/Rec2 family competence protein [Parcubacteria group bacterium]
MRLSQSKIFLVCLLAFVAGVGVASFASIAFVYAYGTLLVTAVLVVIFWSKRQYRIMALWGIFFVLGAIRFSLAQPQVSDPWHIAYYNGQDVVIQGVVGQEPDVRLDHQKLTLRARRVGQSDVKGRLLIKTELYPEYEYGDLVEVKCQIEAPEQIEDFAYDKYLARYDIYSVCWRGTITKVESGQGNLAMAGILFVKTRFMDSINSIISEPHAAFLSGLLVGARRGIPEYLLEAFARTGTTHIIAISGSNITIIAAVIIGFMQFLGVSRKRAFWWISGAIAIFVIMTGATASVVRAGIMGIFVLLARQLGRPSRATNALVFTAFLMLLVNPKILIFDAGFQLSFLATVGLVYINPILQKHAERMPELFGVKEALVTTISAMVTTTPLILYQFGRLSIVAPLANILIIPGLARVALAGVHDARCRGLVITAICGV